MEHIFHSKFSLFNNNQFEGVRKIKAGHNPATWMFEVVVCDKKW